MLKMKLAAILGAAALISALTTPSLAASVGVGFSGQGTLLEITGQEKLKGNSDVTKYDSDQGIFLPAGFVQFTFGDDGFVVGFEHIPGDATLGNKTLTRSNVGATSAVRTDLENKASAKLEDHRSWYIESPSFGSPGLYVKYSWHEVSVITDESLGTGGTYGDQDLNGSTIGVGLRTNGKGLLMKLEANYTDWDSISITSAADDASESSVVSGDIDSTGLKVSIGYNF